MFYLRQIGSFYIGWMDNISSSPPLIETTLFNSNIWKLMFMFFTDWQVGENFKDILWKSMNCWSSPLPSYTSLKLWGFELNLIWKRPKRRPTKSHHFLSFEDMNWILSESDQKGDQQKVTKKGNKVRQPKKSQKVNRNCIYKCCDNLAWTSSPLILE